MQIKSFSAGVLVTLALALTSSLAVADHPRILIDCGGITGNAGSGVTTASPATYSPYVNVYWNNFSPVPVVHGP